MISKQEVQHIAKLARLGLSEKEIEKFQKELSSILDYIEKLKEVDISEVKPMSHSITSESVMRDDVGEDKQENENEKLLKSAPERKERHIKVKQVL
jgi:aspartyl/glutamyl-tRNA(Asn/Gln) amidotransferase C subunit